MGVAKVRVGVVSDGTAPIQRHTSQCRLMVVCVVRSCYSG